MMIKDQKNNNKYPVLLMFQEALYLFYNLRGLVHQKVSYIEDYPSNLLGLPPFYLSANQVCQ